MKSWDEFRDEVRRRKQERWVEILNSEPIGRLPGRRPRDPEKERLLLEMDKRRLAESSLLQLRRKRSVDAD